MRAKIELLWFIWVLFFIEKRCCQDSTTNVFDFSSKGNELLNGLSVANDNIYMLKEDQQNKQARNFEGIAEKALQLKEHFEKMNNEKEICEKQNFRLLKSLEEKPQEVHYYKATSKLSVVVEESSKATRMKTKLNSYSDALFSFAFEYKLWILSILFKEDELKNNYLNSPRNIIIPGKSWTCYNNEESCFLVIESTDLPEANEIHLELNKNSIIPQDISLSLVQNETSVYPIGEFSYLENKNYFLNLPENIEYSSIRIKIDIHKTSPNDFITVQSVQVK
eukprot:snap_masked-scaffold_16-processed-gene-4.12-mRNA-1 protein AED:1.00 eAED:1.00 QI:0/-1/0/0/-1/1/1/0/278